MSTTWRESYFFSWIFETFLFLALRVLGALGALGAPTSTLAQTFAAPIGANTLKRLQKD